MLSRFQKHLVNFGMWFALVAGVGTVGSATLIGLVELGGLAFGARTAHASVAPLLPSVESIAASSGASGHEPGTVVQCGATATVLLAKNPTRHGYMFQVDMANNTEAVYISLGPNAEVEESMPYGGPDGFTSGKAENGPSVYGGTISCISDSGNENVYVEEY